MEFKGLKRQYLALRPQILQALEQVLEQGQYIGGPAVEGIEKQLARQAGVAHCVSCANGTDALVLLLKALGVGPGDVVFIPVFTFFATAEAVSLVGATPCFVDVDFPGGNINTVALEQALRQEKWKQWGTAKAILAVDLFGWAAEYDIIEPMANHYGMLLLEDCAQGFGGSCRGRPNGSFGAGAAVSFFPAKPLGCFGDGGAVLTNNGETAVAVRSLACHGAGKSKYENVRIGQNSRLDALQAAVLQVKLEAFPKEQARLRQIARWYTSQLQGLGAALPPCPENAESAWAQYTMVLSSKSLRQGLQSCLNSQGIPTMVYYPTPLHLQPAYGFLGGSRGDFPTAELLSNCALSLPLHPYMTDGEAETVVEAVKGFLKRAKTCSGTPL